MNSTSTRINNSAFQPTKFQESENMIISFWRFRKWYKYTAQWLSNRSLWPCGVLLWSGLVYYDSNCWFLHIKQIVKGIDALSREQLVQITTALGIRNSAPIFSMVPTFGRLRPAGLLPTITEEDKVILNNVQKVLEFLTGGGSKSTINQVCLDSVSTKRYCLIWLV